MPYLILITFAKNYYMRLSIKRLRMKRRLISKLKRGLVMRKAKRHYRAKRDNASCFDETFLKSFAEELYNAIVEIVKEGKLLVKNELKEELRNELSTKEDILLVKKEIEMVRNELNQKIEITKKELEYKMIIQTLIILFAIIITNQNAIELIKLLFGFR